MFPAIAIALTVTASAASAPPIVTPGATRTPTPPSMCAPDPGGDVHCILSAAPEQRIVIRTRLIAPSCSAGRAQVVDMPGHRIQPKDLPAVEPAASPRPCA